MNGHAQTRQLLTGADLFLQATPETIERGHNHDDGLTSLSESAYLIQQATIARAVIAPTAHDVLVLRAERPATLLDVPPKLLLLCFERGAFALLSVRRNPPIGESYRPHDHPRVPRYYPR